MPYEIKRINQSRHSQKEKAKEVLPIVIWRVDGITDPRSIKEFVTVKMETCDHRRNRRHANKRTSTIHQKNHRRSRTSKYNNWTKVWQSK